MILLGILRKNDVPVPIQAHGTFTKSLGHFFTKRYIRANYNLFFQKISARSLIKLGPWLVFTWYRDKRWLNGVRSTNLNTYGVGGGRDSELYEKNAFERLVLCGDMFHKLQYRGNIWEQNKLQCVLVQRQF